MRTVGVLRRVVKASCLTDAFALCTACTFGSGGTEILTRTTFAPAPSSSIVPDSLIGPSSPVVGSALA
jgi:hypothetical protein